MRALTCQGNEHVAVTEVPDPVIQERPGTVPAGSAGTVRAGQGARGRAPAKFPHFRSGRREPLISGIRPPIPICCLLTRGGMKALERMEALACRI
jgi:hypothetical protein